MNSNNYSEPETENDVQLEDEEQALSSGNGKLAIIVGAVVVLAGLGYAFAPGKTGKAPISSVMPSITLGDATVTGSRPAEEAAPATEEAPEDDAKPAGATATVAARPVARPAAAASAAPAAAEAAQTAAPAVEEAAAPAAVAEPANVTVSGRILDEEGKPMAGATVMLKGSRKVASTDANGNYSMEVPAGDNTLSYGYGGYQDQEMRARGAQPLNVTLLPKEGAKRRRK